MAHDRALHVHAGDPLAAGLDEVLGAVGDLHVAVGVDRGHVAGAEPAVLGELRRRRRDCRSSRGHPRARAPGSRPRSGRPTAAPARPRPRCACPRRPRRALLGADGVALVVGPAVQVRARAAHRAERASSRSCPTRGACTAPYFLSNVSMRRARGRRAADGDAADRRDVPLRLLLEDPVDGDPHRGHRAHDGDPLACTISMMSRGCGFGPPKIWVAPFMHAGEGHAPRIGVEHGHDVQDDVALADAEHVHRGRGEAVEEHAAVRVHARPWGGRWCRTCSTCRRRRSPSSLGHSVTGVAAPTSAS